MSDGVLKRNRNNRQAVLHLYVVNSKKVPYLRVNKRPAIKFDSNAERAVFK